MKGEMKKVATTAVKAHEAKMHKGAKKMAKGGVTTQSRAQHGRNKAKAMACGGKA
jgi:hypothetical protein